MTSGAPFADLGVHTSANRGELRVWSANATSIELCIFDNRDPHWVVKTLQLKRHAHDIWSASSIFLTPGRRYAIRVDGPQGPNNTFNNSSFLLDPYARGVVRIGPDQWRSAVVDTEFDWQGVTKPQTPYDRTVIYEAHVKGMSKLNPGVPAALRGTYAGLGHESTIGYLKGLGVTAIELLPVQAFSSEQRLMKQGLSNYWGYNTLAFFAPHSPYASRTAQQAGPDAVLREFKEMVRSLHEAGLEVIMDVVYNHTAEEGIGGPRSSFRGIDNADYYRQLPSGQYIDTTGCGNSLDFGKPAAQHLVLDSIKYWANEVQIDGFRFDLAASLGRNAEVNFDRDHPLLLGLRDDPELAGVKLIAEPWDVSAGGWQTGHFPSGWTEWNDRYRDRVRDFWLSDIRALRHGQPVSTGIGNFASKLAGSAHIFDRERGPLASVNFITAHDGFTAADLTAYNSKHNLGNGENNRDGTDNNHSFNFGSEGPTTNRWILSERARAVRNLLGTLLLSAGVPMITAGDEYGRTQRGNNNPYCHDSELNWLSWRHDPEQDALRAIATRLLTLRRENPALRPIHYAVRDRLTPSASEMHWYNPRGEPMSSSEWNEPDSRTLQYLAVSTPEFEESNRILLVVHGVESDATVTLPVHEGVNSYILQWDSSDDAAEQTVYEPGDTLIVTAASMQLFRLE